MAPSFSRSISFPLSPSRSSSTKPRSSSSAAAAYHARSVSLPCRSHPILAHLHAHISAVRAWAQYAATSGAATGLAHVDALHAALGDLLDLPEAQAALSLSATGDRLLDAFLRLADAHGSFQEAVVELKRDVAEALAAVRRRDGARLASALRSQRKAGKDLARLAASAARDGAAAGGCGRPSRLGLGSAAEVEVAALLAEAAAATAAASAALFGTVAAMSASASAAACSCKRTAALMCLTKKVSEEEKETVALVERLEELEECIDGLEAGSDKVFRTLVQTRVALLNIHTHIF
ncbi:unnamed protein product [Miscanthus lutarioriparius]|uniref:Uncharacterized protein n=1 Tax=Miscanthus lutarioriparius TaxID=422564 RepID=A0A811S9L3_9POAL|nr:unnamed protein product [Miscanthus lutarioriparius]